MMSSTTGLRDDMFERFLKVETGGELMINERC